MTLDPELHRAWVGANPTKRVFADVEGAVPAWVRFHGERRLVLACQAGAAGFAKVAVAASARGAREGAALLYGFTDGRSSSRELDALGWELLGPVPALVRPLRLSSAAARLRLPAVASALLPNVPLVAPFGRQWRAGVREITALPVDVRITRLWDRFSVDVGVALERNASFFGWRIHDRPASRYRIFILEDGDRYAIRAMCIFTVEGHVMELLHDRSVAGMRAASHLLGLALREMSDAGADSAVALSLPHSGSYPIYRRHAFFAAAEAAHGSQLAVRALDESVEDGVMRRDRWYVSYLDAMDV